jgi:type II secretory pathway pseudopilin PulG
MPVRGPGARTARSGTSKDAGFSLLEVIVALGIILLVVITLLPQLIVGIRATGTARLVTQAKGVVQGELERMRNLPFHISPAAGDYRDVLDFHYRNLVQPTTTPVCTTGSGDYALPQTGWSGYVPPGGARCAYEPSTGAFYRTVKQVPASGGTAAFSVVLSTRFLSGSTPPEPVTPPTGYDTQTNAGARPASSQLGVTATVLYADRGAVRPVSNYTQIAEQTTSTTRVRAEVNVAAVDAGSVTTGNGAASLSAGLLTLTGALTYASTSSANLTGSSAGLATGEQGSGASVARNAPPATGTGVTTAAPGLLGTNCDIACWGSTRLEIGELTAEQGLPRAGSATSPMQSLLTDTTYNGVSFGNTAGGAYRPALSLSAPLVRLDPQAASRASGIAAGCVAGGTGTLSYVTAGGYLRTTAVDDATSPSTVEACGVASASAISILPTTFAPRGVVLVELRRASARCQVSGTAHTPTVGHDFEAVVKHWDTKGEGPDDDGYTTAATIVPGMTADPLDQVAMATVVEKGAGGAADKLLSDYIASWSSLTAAKVGTTQTAGLAEVRLPGVVTIVTQPVRNSADGTPDETSVVSLAVGALRCSAQDAR